LTWQTDANAAVMQLLRTFDHKLTWREAKAPHATQQVVSHVRHFTGDESELINAWGETGVEIFVEATSIQQEPVKFDTFTLDGEKWTVGAVHNMYGFNNQLLFYKLYCRGGR
jgi:hypothetical protein